MVKDNTQQLIGLKVLITRPKHQSVNLLNLLNKAGAIVFQLPVMNIVPTINHASVNDALEQYNHADIIIFTSSNAVTHAKLAIEHAERSWPPSQTILAIGEATRQMLNVSDCNKVIIPENDFSSEGLLNTKELQNIEDKTILIFGGANPRPFLEKQLKARGAQVIHAACYAREALPSQLTANEQMKLLNQIDVVICTSTEIVTNLIHSFDKRFHNQLFDKEFIVTSSRIQATLTASGYLKSPIIADNPTDHSIMSALTFWYEEHHHD